jgi:molybdopterin/thiamine biosynthesis adenylyltransferase
VADRPGAGGGDGGGGAGRFARHHAIPGWDQDRLAAAVVVVAGAGALGNEVVKNHALSGVGRVVLCDPDVVATSNLSRSVLFRPADVGEPKVSAIAAASAELAPATTVDPRAADLVSAIGLGELADAAVVIGCLDSIRARLQLLGRCALVDAPLVDGGTHPWGGEVRVRLSSREACFGCTLTARERSASDVPWSCADEEPERPASASIVGTAIVAGWMTLAALRIVFGDPPPFRLLAVEGGSGTTAAVDMRRDPACPYHRPLEGRADPLPVRHTDTVGALLASLSPDARPLAWNPVPVATPGTSRCDGCLREYTAARDGPAPCPHCGTRPRLAVTLSLRDADPGAVLHDLGVPPEEILPVQGAEGGYRWFRLKA